MNNIVKFEQIQRELDTISLIEQEAREETKAIFVLTCTTYQDLFPSEIKHLSRSIAAQFREWLSEDDAPTADELALCMNAHGHLEKFAEYVTSKYTNKAKRTQWEALFANADVKAAIINFIYQKAFEAKSELEINGRRAFFTVEGLKRYLNQQFEKTSRAFQFEARGKLCKAFDQDVNMKVEEAAKIVIPALQDRLDEIENNIIEHFIQYRRLPNSIGLLTGGAA
jgi:hypothetical protein